MSDEDHEDRQWYAQVCRTAKVAQPLSFDRLTADQQKAIRIERHREALYFSNYLHILARGRDRKS